LVIFKQTDGTNFVALILCLEGTIGGERDLTGDRTFSRSSTIQKPG
jgi:hypothetical protein